MFHQGRPHYRNDIAMIRLPVPARNSQVVQVVCLPMAALSPDMTKAGIVVGWGKTSNEQSIANLTGVYSEKQQKLEVINFFLLQYKIKCNNPQQIYKIKYTAISTNMDVHCTMY